MHGVVALLAVAAAVVAAVLVCRWLGWSDEEFKSRFYEED